MERALTDPQEFQVFSKKLFDDVDTDKSGSVNRRELRHVLNAVSQALGKPLPTENEIETLMITLDADRDGKINFQEFQDLAKVILETLASK